MDVYQIPCPFNDQSGSRICERENPGIGHDLFFPNIILEPVGNLQGQKDSLRFLPTLGVSDGGFTIFNILWSEFQDLPDPHAATGHEFEHKPVSWMLSPENDFIDQILFRDLELGWFRSSEQFAQRWIVTRVLTSVIEGVFHKVEKGRQKAETEFLCVLFGAIRNR